MSKLVSNEELIYSSVDNGEGFAWQHHTIGDNTCPYRQSLQVNQKLFDKGQHGGLPASQLNSSITTLDGCGSLTLQIQERLVPLRLGVTEITKRATQVTQPSNVENGSPGRSRSYNCQFFRHLVDTCRMIHRLSCNQTR